MRQAPKAPWTTRNAITRPMLLAVSPDSPIAAENRAKPTIPSRRPSGDRTGRPPSDRDQGDGEGEHVAVRDPLDVEIEACRCDWMEGFATITMVASRATIITPRHTAPGQAPAAPLAGPRWSAARVRSSACVIALPFLEVVMSCAV